MLSLIIIDILSENGYSGAFFVSYFFIPPSKEFCRSFFVCGEHGYAALTVDEQCGTSYLCSGEGAAGRDKIAWHNATVLVDPFLVHATILQDNLPLSESKLRQRFSYVADEPYVAASNADKGGAQLSYTTKSAVLQTLQAANNFGIYPQSIQDASVVWYGLRDYFSVPEEEIAFAIIKERTVIFYVNGLV